MKRLFAGVAMALALPIAACASDASEYARHHAQCNAAIDARDDSSMAAYCTLAAEDLGLIQAGMAPDSRQYATVGLLRAEQIYFAATGYAQFNSDRAIEQFRSVGMICHDLIAAGRLSPDLAAQAQQLNVLAARHAGDL